jgi:hypothetical protein
MGLMASGKSTGSGFEPVPEGSHLARCVNIVDLGLQETPRGGKEKVFFAWEVPGVRVKWEKDGVEHEGPALVSSTYNLSIHPLSILGQQLESWRGKKFTDEERDGFDLFKVLGAPCMISITHNRVGDKTYANVSAIIKVPTGTEVPPAETELIGYTATDPKYSGTLDKLPQWLRDKALAGQRQAPVEPAEPNEPAVPADFDDDIPF